MGNAQRAEAAEALGCVGFETITVTTAAKALTLPAAAVQAQCQVQDQPVRWRVDGTDPTDVTGVEANDGDEMAITGRATLSAFRVIRHSESSAGGKLVCHYYG